MKPSSPPDAMRSATVVVGSKGGVGKTCIVANLGIALGRCGRRVLMVDGALGLANLDVMLGLLPRLTVEQVVAGEAELHEVLVEGPEGVRLLPAASGIPELSELDDPTRARLIHQLAEGCSDVDEVLVDTGAGLGRTTLALQRAASRILLVTTPEPTSLVDAYATLKVIWTADPAKTVDVIVNAAEDDTDANIAYEQIARAADQFLGRRPGLLGSVYRDPRVPEAVRKQRAILELFPDSAASRCYESLALRLTLKPDPPAEVDDFWSRLDSVQQELTH